MTGRAGTAAEPSLIYVVGRINQGIRRELRARLRDWELSVPELTALSVLHGRPGLSNAQLARRTMVTPQSMLEILAGLEDRGLVTRTLDPDHGRIRRAALTRAGQRVVAATEPVIAAVQDEMLRDVSPQQREIVLAALLKMMDRLRPGL